VIGFVIPARVLAHRVVALSERRKQHNDALVSGVAIEAQPFRRLAAVETAAK
jgi:hypothetical protein